LHLKELKLWYDADDEDDFDYNFKITGAMIDSLFSEALCKLSLSCVVTPETAKAIRESCPNIKFLQITIASEIFLSSIIPPICELSSLKTLKIGCIGFSGPLVKILGDNLKFVEYLSLKFNID
jgi:hypothetical protein